MRNQLSTAEVKARLATKFGFEKSGGSQICFFEVADSTGSERSRTADAISMQLWPSRGLTVSGFEIKTSRSDWVKELKTPAKAEWFWKRCDYWSLVVGDKTIVKPGELPESWGLLVPHGKGLKVEVKPERLEKNELDRGFVASMLRAAARYTPPDQEQMEAELTKRWKEGYAIGCDHEKQANNHRLERYERLQKEVHEFEKNTGICVSGWKSDDPKRLGQVIDAIKKMDTRLDKLAELVEAVDCLRQHLPAVQEMLKS